MTDTAPTPAPGRRRLLMDMVGLVLILAGVAGVAAAAFAVDWRAGLAVVSAAVIVAGVALGTGY